MSSEHIDKVLSELIEEHGEEKAAQLIYESALRWGKTRMTTVALTGVDPDPEPGPCPECGGESTGDVLYSCPLQTTCRDCGHRWEFGPGISVRPQPWCPWCFSRHDDAAEAASRVQKIEAFPGAPWSKGGWRCLECGSMAPKRAWAEAMTWVARQKGFDDCEFMADVKRVAGELPDSFFRELDEDETEQAEERREAEKAEDPDQD